MCTSSDASEPELEDAECERFLDFELRSLGLSEYLLLECFSRDLERFLECLLLWRLLLGDFVLDLERPIFSSFTVLSPLESIVGRIRDRDY